MSVTSSRILQVEFSGDIDSQIIQSALDNVFSPAKIDIISLVLGANTISAPLGAAIQFTGLTIIPPAGNTSLITLKGVTGDTGVLLHKTDPTSLALDSTFLTLVLNAAAAIVGVRLIWT